MIPDHELVTQAQRGNRMMKSIQFILCFFLRHNLQTLQIFSFEEHEYGRKLKCLRCGGYYWMAEPFEAMLLPWDEGVEDLYCSVFKIRRTNI